MTADKNPIEDVVEQAFDAFVYAPIGLLFDGPARFPKLVRNGRNQVTNARMMGQFAVKMGKTEVTKRTADLDGPIAEVLRGLGLSSMPTPAPTPTQATVPTARTEDDSATSGANETTPAAKKTSTKKTATKSAAKKRPAKKSAAKKRPAKKAAPERTTTTKAATTDAPTAAPAPAAATAPAASALPIPDYDSLSASQVVSRLRGLDAGELEAVRSYEATTRSRKTILNRVQQLAKS